MEHVALLSFRAVGRRLALPLSDVQCVAPLPLLLPPVAAPDFVEGFFDYQGMPTAVIRLDRLLDAATDALGLYSPLLLLASDGLAVALHVSAVDTILRVAARELQALNADETFNGSVAGRVTHNGETVYVLSTQRLLLETERQRLASHESMQRRRLDALDSHAAS